MSDDETHAKLNEFDREPSTNSDNQNGSVNQSDQLRPFDRSTTPQRYDQVVKVEQVKHDNEFAHTHSDKHELNPVSQGIEPATIRSVPLQPQQEVILPKQGPGLMVLQWLTYAFWGWTVFVLGGLIFLVVNQLVSGMDNDSYSLVSSLGGGIAYLLAATIVLYIISLCTDVFYARAEKRHSKSSGNNVIMIIHAVIFALFGIGALIIAVFGLVSLLIGDTDDSASSLGNIISAAIVFALYGVTLLRALRPKWLKGVTVIYWGIMSVVVLASVVLGIVGPAAQARLANQDNTAERGMPVLADAINTQANKTGALPESLEAVNDVSDDAEKLIRDKLVTYTPGKKVVAAQEINLNDSSSDVSRLQQEQTPIYEYQLCVTYKTKDQTGSYDGYGDITNSSGMQRDTTIDTYGHKAGRVCYDLQTRYDYDSTIY